MGLLVAVRLPSPAASKMTAFLVLCILAGAAGGRSGPFVLATCCCLAVPVNGNLLRPAGGVVFNCRAELIGVVAEDQMQGIRCQLCDGVKRIREHGFSGQVQQRFGPAGSGSFALAGGQQNDGFSRFMHFGWGSWRAVRSFCSGRVLLPGCASEWESFEASWRCRFQLPCAELIGVVAEDQMQGIRCQLCDGVKRIREHGFSGQVQQRFGPAGSGSFALAGGQQNDGFSRFMHFGWGSWRAVRSFCSGHVLLPGCASEWESFEASWRCRFQLPCGADRRGGRGPDARYPVPVV